MFGQISNRALAIAAGIVVIVLVLAWAFMSGEEPVNETVETPAQTTAEPSTDDAATGESATEEPAAE